MEILKDEFFYIFNKLINKQEIDLQPLKVQYKDFVYWHNKILKDENFKRQAHEYWSDKINGDIPDTKVSISINNKIDANIGKGYISFLDSQLSKKVKQIATDNQTTIFNVLFSAFNLLISYLSGEKTIMCGTPSAGRAHISTQKIVGFFINPLPIITKIDYDEDFISLVNRMGNEIRNALEYQNYPLELVLHDLKINFPNINVYFDMLNYRDDERKQMLQSFDPYYSDLVLYAKYDLYLLVTEYKNGIQILWNCREALFKDEEIETIM